MKKYDIVIVVFNKLNYDARALNLAKTLHSLKFNVLVVSLNSKNNIQYPFDNLEVDLKENLRIFIKWIYFHINVKKILKKIEYNTFIASDLYSLTNVLISKNNVSTIYDSREIYSGLASLNNRCLSQKIITFIEKFMLRQVNKVIVSGELDKEYLQKIQYFTQEFYIIKNFPPETKLNNTNYLRNKYNIDKDFKIAIYQGVLIKNRGLFAFMEAMKQIKDIVFVLVGENQIEIELSDYISKNGLINRCFIHPAVDYHKLLSITQSADFGISLFEPVSDSYKYALPNKIFEYLNCDLPYLATNLPAIKKLTDESKAGVLVNDVNNIEELSSQIRFLIKNYVQYKQNAIINRNRFTYESQIDEIKRLVNHV